MNLEFGIWGLEIWVNLPKLWDLIEPGTRICNLYLEIGKLEPAFIA